ncbi:MAG TPA: tetratricopeptide repeat protein [Candidatus Acidoferrales bacterium]|nr:tetratricopeptide repeat protein [Candidatus Acidoferrales bacterium]
MRLTLARLVCCAALVIFTAGIASAADDLSTVEEQFAAGDYGDAINTLRAIVSQNAGDAPAHYWLGRCYYEERDYNNAVTQLQQAASLDAKSSVYHQWLGRAYGEKADVEHSFLLARQVKKEFEAAVQADPSNIQARRDLEDYLLEAPWIVGGSKDDALTQVNEIAKLDPIQGHLARADYDAHLGKDNDASSEYNQALSMRPQTIDPYFEIADYYAKKQNSAALQQVITQAEATDPRDPRLTFYHGETRVISDTDLTLAEEELKSYIARSPQRSDWPSHSRARYWLGALYEKQGDKVAASEQYRAALQLDAGNKAARQALDNLEKSMR